MAPIREFGDPIADAVGPTQYTVAQSLFDEMVSKGARNYWTSWGFTELSDSVFETVVEYADQLPTPQSEITLHQVGGAINDVATDATAYPHRETEFLIEADARWEDPTKDGDYIEWARECRDALAEDSTGQTYVNFISEHEDRG